MEDNERGCEKEKRRDTADVREKAAPVRDRPFGRPGLGPLGVRRRESLSHPLDPLGAPVLVPVGRPGSAPLTIREKGWWPRAHCDTVRPAHGAGGGGIIW